MVMDTDYKHELHDTTSMAQTLNDLLPFLQSISLDSIKEFVHQEIETMRFETSADSATEDSDHYGPINGIYLT